MLTPQVRLAHMTLVTALFFQLLVQKSSLKIARAPLAETFVEDAHRSGETCEGDAYNRDSALKMELQTAG